MKRFEQTGCGYRCSNHISSDNKCAKFSKVHDANCNEDGCVQEKNHRLALIDRNDLNTNIDVENIDLNNPNEKMDTQKDNESRNGNGTDHSQQNL